MLKGVGACRGASWLLPWLVFLWQGSCLPGEALGAASSVCVEVVVCKTDNNLNPHGTSDGYGAFLESLWHVNRLAGEEPPPVHNVCEGLQLQDYMQAFDLKRKLVMDFVLRREERSSGQCLLTAFIYLDAMDVVFGQPLSALKERFWELSAGGVKLVLGSEMSCWVGQVCTEVDEPRLFPNSSASATSSRYVNSGGLMGTQRAMAQMYKFINSGTDQKQECAHSGDEQCDVARYARSFVPRGLVVLDERQSIFGSLLVSSPHIACPGDCHGGQYPFFCACLTCARDQIWNCAGNAAYPRADLDAMFRLDELCRLTRHLDAEGLQRYGDLEPMPVAWHGNGPGKITFERHLPHLLECFQQNAQQQQHQQQQQQQQQQQPLQQQQLQQLQQQQQQQQQQVATAAAVASTGLAEHVQEEVVKPASEDAWDFWVWITRLYAVWPPDFGNPSCDHVSISSPWMTFKRFLNAYMDGISFSAEGGAINWSLKDSDDGRFTIFKMAEPLAGFHTKSDATECPLGLIAAHLVTYVEAAVAGNDEVIQDMVWSNLGCGLEVVLNGYLQHTVLSGWPILRLLALVGKALQSRFKSYDEPMAVGLAGATGTCPSCYGARNGVATLCEYYGFLVREQCPMVRLKVLFLEASTGGGLESLLGMERELQKLLEARGQSSERNFVALLHNAARMNAKGHCRKLPRLLMDFLVLGLWQGFAAVEQELVSSTGFGDRDRPHKDFVDAIFTRLRGAGGSTDVGVGAGAPSEHSTRALSLPPGSNNNNDNDSNNNKNNIPPSSAFDSFFHSCSEVKKEHALHQAWVTVLSSRSSAAQIRKYAEAVLVLQRSLVCTSNYSRPFLVLTDGELPEQIARMLTAGGAILHPVDTSKVDDMLRTTFPRAAESIWNRERGFTRIMSMKFYLWTLTSYRKLVFLDADMLVLQNIEDLFDVPGNVLLSDPVIWWRSSTSLLNFGMLSLTPSMQLFDQIWTGMWACAERGDYPNADMTDATVLDCMWRQLSRGLGLARFHFDALAELPACKKDAVHGAGSENSCIASPHIQKAPVAYSFSGCFEPDRPVFHAANVLMGPGLTRCVLPLSFAAPVDFASLYWLLTRHFFLGSLQGQRPSSAVKVADKLAGQLNELRWDGFVEGLKVLHWPSQRMKPWDHCSVASRTAADQLWWQLRATICSSGKLGCRAGCSEGDHNGSLSS